MVLDHRLDKLKLEIKSSKLEAVLISKVANIIYLTDYSGFSKDDREAFLLITPNKQFVLTDGRYSGAVKNEIPNFELVEISRQNKFIDLFRRLISKVKISELGVEENDLRVSEFNQIEKVIKNLKDFKFHEHRSIKAPEEIELIEKACEIGDQTFKFILPQIKSGISEKEVSFILENFIRQKGFEPSFKTIVAFGKNSAIPHHLSGEAKLEKGEYILLDFGVRFKQYCSDMTRTLVFGKASEKQKKIYKVVLGAQKKAFEFLEKGFKDPTPGVGSSPTASEVDKTARDYILDRGFPSIPHSLGHGVGIEVHEHPYLSVNSKEILKEGMVFSIEPGIYLPGFGGVRIEDLFVIEKKGLRRLTNSSNELIEV